MTRYFRLRNGRTTWCQGNLSDSRRHLAGRIAKVPESLPDGSKWQLVLTLECQEFTAIIRIRTDEPEFAALKRALSEAHVWDSITLSGSGRIAKEGGSPSPVVESRPMTIIEQMEAADSIVAGFRERAK